MSQGNVSVRGRTLVQPDPIHIAAARGDVRLLGSLLKEGANVNARLRAIACDNDGCAFENLCALHVAIAFHSFSPRSYTKAKLNHVVEALLNDTDIDVNAVARRFEELRDCSPLFACLRNNLGETIPLLVSHGASVLAHVSGTLSRVCHSFTFTKAPPILYAMVSTMISTGLDDSNAGHDSFSALLEPLHEHNADPNATCELLTYTGEGTMIDLHHGTALHASAAFLGPSFFDDFRRGVERRLQCNGAAVNARCALLHVRKYDVNRHIERAFSGATPLHIALVMSESVRELLELGADPCMTLASGEGALDLLDLSDAVFDAKRKKIVMLALIRFGAEVPAARLEPFLFMESHDNHSHPMAAAGPMQAIGPSGGGDVIMTSSAAVLEPANTSPPRSLALRRRQLPDPSWRPWHPVFKAVMCNDLDALQNMVRRGENFKSENIVGSDTKGDLDLVGMADVSPLHAALYTLHNELVPTLLQLGIDPNARAPIICTFPESDPDEIHPQYEDVTAIHMASNYWHAEQNDDVLQALLDAGAVINAVAGVCATMAHTSPLAIIIQQHRIWGRGDDADPIGLVECMRRFLAAGADANFVVGDIVKDDDFTIDPAAVVMLHHIPIICLTAINDVDVRFRGDECSYEHTLESLLQHSPMRVDVSAALGQRIIKFEEDYRTICLTEDATALHILLQDAPEGEDNANLLQITRTLLDYDRAVDLERPAGRLTTVRSAHEFPTEVEVRIAWRPIHVAAARGAHTVLKLLCERGADVDGRTADGQTALMVAACRARDGLERGGQEDCCRALVAAGASVGARDHAGNTALHHAARVRNAGPTATAVVELLLGKKSRQRSQARCTPSARARFY